MTLEQADERTLNAVRSGDLAALQTALLARADAIEELSLAPASPRLAGRVSAAIEAGKIVEDALRAIKLRLGMEGARLAQFQTGFTTGLGAGPRRRLDCRG